MANRTYHPPLTRNLVLIGGRGCGKSSVGKRLALRNRSFQLFSLDALIRYESEGLPIPEIVERHGWERFRDLEYEAVRKVSSIESGAIVDCGGGVVVDLDSDGEEVYSERKVEALRRHGLVVYLRRDPDYLAGRIESDSNRPSLSASHSFQAIMARRDPWYRRAAHTVIDCDDIPKPEIADRVLTWFYEQIGVDPQYVRINRAKE